MKYANWAAGAICILTISAAHAADTGAPVSVTTNPESPPKAIGDQIIGIIPQVGMTSFMGNDGSYTSRASAGIGLEANVAPLISDVPSSLYLALDTGFFYTHQGSDTSNFFGSSPTLVSSTFSTGANLALIPSDIKIGYNISDKIRVSIHGGGNVIYRSVAGSVNLGPSSTGVASNWDMYPNLGVDFEYQLSRYVNVIVRPDATATQGTTLFMATVGAVIVPI